MGPATPRVMFRILICNHVWSMNFVNGGEFRWSFFGSMNGVCLSGPLSSGPWTVRLFGPLFVRFVSPLFQESKDQVTGRHSQAHLLFPSAVLLVSAGCFVFRRSFLCVFCLPLSHISRHFCTIDWLLGHFFAPLFVPGTVFLWGRVFCLGGCVWGLVCCVFLAFLRPSPCLLFCFFFFFAATLTTVLGRIAGQLSRVITPTPRFSRQGTPSGRLEQPPALSS